MRTVDARASADPALVAEVEDVLRRQYAADGVPASALRFGSWTPDSARKQRRRLFLSCGTATGTAYVAKIPLDPADEMVAKEYEVLRSPAPEGVARPTLVRGLERGFVMSWVPDRDFPDAFTANPRAAGPRALLERAVDLMLPLHTAPAAAAGDATRIAEAYIGDGLEQAGPAALEALTRTWIGPAHGDLGPWNIRWDSSDGRLSLIDWEDYHAPGITAIDLLNTVLTSALVMFPEYRERGFDWLGDQMFAVEDGPFRPAMRAALRRYARHTGQSAADLARLLPVACLWLHRRIEKQGRPAGHLFYLPLAGYFRRAEPHWIGALDD